MLLRRGSRGEDVKRVQQALLDAGYTIGVDGIFGPQTDSVVRQLQKDRSLDVDGIVGPLTLGALGLAGAPSSAPTSTPASAPSSGPSSMPSFDAATFRAEIVRIAQEEEARWVGMEETDAAMTPTLQQYYREGVGEEVSAKNLQSAAWQENNPWSAVFISWVMRTAGAGTRFAYSKAHYVYTAAAKRNRVAADTSKPFWAYRINELAPDVGDLVCKARGGSGATYDNVDDGTRRSMHCDIVTEVQAGRLIVIGGNVSDDVSDKRLTIDASGHIDLTAPNQGEYMAVIRVEQP
jgi:hypothetical protein